MSTIIINYFLLYNVNVEMSPETVSINDIKYLIDVYYIKLILKNLRVGR